MPLTANDRLVLVRVKIERAKKHFRELEAELLAFRDERLNVVGIKNNSHTGQGTHFHVDLPILPFNAIASAGDVIHNLRSALDHLAYQLVLVGTPHQIPTRRVEFPIAKDVTTYESTKAGKVQGMRPEAIQAIDALKPYRGGNDALWRIHELDNLDKHRTLFTVAHDHLFVADWIPVMLLPYWLKARDPQFVGVFDAEVEQDVQLEIEKAVDKSQPLQGNALLPSLHQLVDFVDDLVPKFLPLLG